MGRFNNIVVTTFSNGQRRRKKARKNASKPRIDRMLMYCWRASNFLVLKEIVWLSHSATIPLNSCVPYPEKVAWGNSIMHCNRGNQSALHMQGLEIKTILDNLGRFLGIQKHGPKLSCRIRWNFTWLWKFRFCCDLKKKKNTCKINVQF